MPSRSASPAEARAHGSHNRAIRPASSPPTDRVLEIASSRSASSARARASRDSPASVRSTRCVERRNRSHPTKRSRLRIWRLSAGWVMNSRCAARLKLRSSATATNARRCRSSIASGACGNASTLRSPSTTPPVCLIASRQVMPVQHRWYAQSAFPFAAGDREAGHVPRTHQPCDN